MTEQLYDCPTRILNIAVSYKACDVISLYYNRWCSGKFGTGGTLDSALPSPPFPSPLPFPPVLPPLLLLEVGLLNTAKGSGSAVSSLSAVWVHFSFKI